MKDDISQKIHGNDVFCIFGKGNTSFSYKHEITPLSKKQRGSSPRKIHLNMTFPASLKKMILILKKTILVFQVDILDLQWFSVLLWRSCI